MATVESLATVVQFFSPELHRQAAHLAVVTADLNAARLEFAAAKASHAVAVRESDTATVTRLWRAVAEKSDTVGALANQADTLREALTADLTATLRGAQPAAVKAAQARDKKAHRDRESEAVVHIRRAHEALADALDTFRCDAGEPSGASLLHSEVSALTKHLDRDAATALLQKARCSGNPAGTVPPVLSEAARQVARVLEILDEPWLATWKARQSATKTPSKPSA